MPAAARTWSRAASIATRRCPPATASSGILPPPPPLTCGPRRRSGPGVEPAVLRGRRDEGRAAALGRAAEDHGPDARLLAHRERQVAQIVAVGAVDAGDDDAVDRVAASSAAPGAAAWRRSALSSS